MRCFVGPTANSAKGVALGIGYRRPSANTRKLCNYRYAMACFHNSTLPFHTMPHATHYISLHDPPVRVPINSTAIQLTVYTLAAAADNQQNQKFQPNVSHINSTKTTKSVATRKTT